MVHLDKEQLLTQGVNALEVAEQIKRFQKGFPFAKLIKPAKVSEGIISLNVKQKKKLQALYEQRGKTKKKVKR